MNVPNEKICPLCQQVNPYTAPCCINCDFPFHSLPSLSASKKAIPAPFKLNDYQVIKQIGKGGMGEVYLAYEKSCSRLVALKRIKPELKDRTMIYNRFLREAKITSQLSHPAIIPIYTLGQEKDFIYYTMPYLQKDTLRDLMKQAREKKGHLHKKEEHQYSIPSLIRYFLPICQAIAYAHSKSVIHRDIKPENVLVGKYGEVLILDWGLAKYMDPGPPSRPSLPPEPDELSDNCPKGMTLPGKVVGTVAYMAPERAMGVEANVQSDIYSLGVILYQILTLHFPFKRGTLAEFRQSWRQESWTDPSEVAPYREVPKALARIAKNCLHPHSSKRIQSVEALIEDLENYLEGRGQWLEVAQIDIHNKKHWEFQENILIPQEMAITPNPQKVDWVNLMIAKQSFQSNTKIEASFTLKPHSKGLGILMGIPEPKVESFLDEGYCLWLSTQKENPSRLFKSGLEIIPLPQHILNSQTRYHIKLEKIDQSIQFFLNEQLIFTYHAHLPLVGAYLGLICRDLLFDLSYLKVHVSSLSIKVNCLKVPDILLASKNYKEALREYRQIAEAFPGRTEGREAMFRAGICLLEQAKNAHDHEEKHHFIQQSLEEFSLMHTTPAAPLEYLGKALVYQEVADNNEESKCYELAFRRYEKHPLIYPLKDHLIYRLYQSAKTKRLATYRFILLLLKYFEIGKLRQDVKALIQQLCNHWEPLPFLANHYCLNGIDERDKQRLIVEMSYRLSKGHVILEVVDEQISTCQKPSYPIEEGLFYLLEMGNITIVEKKLQETQSRVNKALLKQQHENLQLLQSLVCAHQESLVNGLQSFLSRLPQKLSPHIERCAFYLMELSLRKHQPQYVFTLSKSLKALSPSDSCQHHILCYQLWAWLEEKHFQPCEDLFASLPQSKLQQANSLLYFLYACFLAATQGENRAHKHFSVLSDHSQPPSYALGSYFLSYKLNRNKNWIKQAFLWEKRALYRQLALYYHCVGSEERSKYYRKLEQKHYINLEH